MPRNTRWLVPVVLQVEIAQRETNATLGISRAWGVEECSDHRDSPGPGVEDCSELWYRPGLGVWQCSELGDSPGDHVQLGHRPGEEVPLEDPPGEQVRFALAQDNLPAEHFGKLGQRSVLQLLQYSSGTEVVR